MPMSQPTPPDALQTQMGYRLSGRFLEACDCQAICPCWIDQVPDEGRCTGLYVWHIITGDARALGVDGMRVASVSYHQGKRRSSRQTVVLFIDERASDGAARRAGGASPARAAGRSASWSMMLGYIAAQRRARSTSPLTAPRRRSTSRARCA